MDREASYISVRFLFNQGNRVGRQIRLVPYVREGAAGLFLSKRYGYFHRNFSGLLLVFAFGHSPLGTTEERPVLRQSRTVILLQLFPANALDNPSRQDRRKKICSSMEDVIS